jgi:hypothetical protein
MSHVPLFLADAGVPMLFVAFPFAFYLLIPVIALETWVARTVREISFQRRFLGVVAANAFSTIVGWPLAWLVLVLLQIFVIPGGGGGYGLDTPLHKVASVTLQAAWLIPYERDLYWMVPTAALVLLVPAFLITIPSERLVLRYVWRQTAVGERRRFVWDANLCSYAFLVIAGLFWLWYSVTHFAKST